MIDGALFQPTNGCRRTFIGVTIPRQGMIFGTIALPRATQRHSSNWICLGAESLTGIHLLALITPEAPVTRDRRPLKLNARQRSSYGRVLTFELLSES